MYHEKMVLAIKSSGKVLREFKDEVRLPFGTEYSLLIKNLHARRALARVWVDGTEATEGVSLVVPANDSVELERFIKDSNLNEGNRFKFIERTARVEQHRGVGAEDGLIRLEFEFEREWAPYYNPWPNTWYSATGTGQAPSWTHDTFSNSAGTFSDTKSSYGKLHSRGGCSAAVNCSATSTHDPKSPPQDFYFPAASGAARVENDAGITVPGSVSNQQFHWSSGFDTDGVKHVIVLKLIGEVQGQEVAAPVTVKTRQRCTTCRHVNKATAKFCSECGTGLVLV